MRPWTRVANRFSSNRGMTLIENLDRALHLGSMVAISILPSPAITLAQFG